VKAFQYNREHLSRLWIDTKWTITRVGHDSSALRVVINYLLHICGCSANPSTIVCVLKLWCNVQKWPYMDFKIISTWNMSNTKYLKNDTTHIMSKVMNRKHQSPLEMFGILHLSLSKSFWHNFKMSKIFQNGNARRICMYW